MPFAKHETFHIREGWLFKGMNAIEEDPHIFLAEDASERLGLGKNMVRALRFWMTATGLTEEYQEDRHTNQRPTEPFGQLVWESDPYLEEDGTLWLLHYHLIRDANNATAWYWFFSHFSQPVFDQRSFVDTLQSWVISVEGRSISENSLKRDFDCLVRTYLPDRRSRTPEDLIESPLAQLGLMAEANGGQVRRYRLLRPSPAHIDPLILLHILLDRQEHSRAGTRQVGLGDVLREPANVGRVFNIGTSGLSEVITRLNDEYPSHSVHLRRTAGLDQLTLPGTAADEILSLYYERQR
jgi:hypothetical protein